MSEDGSPPHRLGQPPSRPARAARLLGHLAARRSACCALDRADLQPPGAVACCRLDDLRLGPHGRCATHAATTLGGEPAAGLVAADLDTTTGNVLLTCGAQHHTVHTAAMVT
ncbi:MAG: hypothetical protein M3257_00385 [Actinomycetota bacterium]|nr:hypothetical protein [Actinomycetota bacterium]